MLSGYNKSPEIKIKILFIAAFDSPHIRKWYDYFAKQQNIESRLFIAKNHLISNTFFSKLKYYFTIRGIIKRAIKEFKPNIINIHTVHFPNYTVPNYFEGKLVVTPWNGDILWHAYGKEFFFLQILSEKITRKLKERRIAKVLSSASLISYNSEEMGKKCNNLLNSKVDLVKICVPGVDCSIWIKPDNKAVVRKKLGIPVDKFVILSMRNLSDFYNVDVIARSIKIVVENHRDILFVFKHMDSQNLHDITEIVNKSKVADHVRFVGSVDYKQILSYYQASDIGISISSNDSCPMSVLEGMSCQLPMLVGDIPVTREIIENNVNGILVPCKDHISLAETILRLKENPELRERLGFNARESVVVKYDYSENMQRMLKLFNKLV